jgi:hypothetical protein
MAGRPSKITQDVLAKLEEAFLLGHSDEEACLLTQIDHSTLYRYCQKHPNFASKKELFKNSPKIKARRNIIEKINQGDVELSKWYLERKAKIEFSTKQEIDSNTIIGFQKDDPLEGLSKMIKQIIEE